MLGVMPARSSTRSTPICAQPLAAPLPNARPSEGGAWLKIHSRFGNLFAVEPNHKTCAGSTGPISQAIDPLANLGFMRWAELLGRYKLINRKSP